MAHKHKTTQELKPKIKLRNANVKVNHRGYFVPPKGHNEMENQGEQ